AEGADGRGVLRTGLHQPGAECLRAMAGDGKLRIKVAAASANGRRGVEIDIEDSGPGIAQGLEDQIFNPFFTTKKHGVGLGLSIVSKIVDEHHGWIRVASEPGKGACFRVRLPAE